MVDIVFKLKRLLKYDQLYRCFDSVPIRDKMKYQSTKDAVKKMFHINDSNTIHTTNFQYKYDNKE